VAAYRVLVSEHELLEAALPGTESPRVIFFDAYGTIFTSGDSDDPTADLRRGLAEAGVEVDHDLLAAALKREMNHYRHRQRGVRTREELEELRRECGQIIIDGLGGAGVCPLSDAEVAAILIATFPGRVFPDLAEAVARARTAGCRVGVLSNFSYLLPMILDDLGIGGDFDFVIHSAGVGFEKPHPRIFHAALQTAAVAPHQAALIGDTYGEDMAGATAAGMIAVFLDRSGGSTVKHELVAANLPDAVELALNARAPKSAA
jgi:FMN phosphatase YigB (HAD superfamily)